VGGRLLSTAAGFRYDSEGGLNVAWWRCGGEPLHVRNATNGEPGVSDIRSQLDEGVLMGFRLFPRFHPRHQLRRTFRAGPLRLHVGPDGVSWGLGAGRWAWNAKSRRHTVDTPGPGYWESRGRRPRP